MLTHGRRKEDKIKEFIGKSIADFLGSNTWAILLLAFAVANLYISTLLVPVFKAIDSLNHTVEAQEQTIKQIQPAVDNISSIKQKVDDINITVNKLLDLNLKQK